MSRNARRVTCDECDKSIEEQAVWYRPSGPLEWRTFTQARFVGQVSTEPMENARSLHPQCFSFRFGVRWPPEPGG